MSLNPEFLEPGRLCGDWKGEQAEVLVGVRKSSWGYVSVFLFGVVNTVRLSCAQVAECTILKVKESLRGRHTYHHIVYSWVFTQKLLARLGVPHGFLGIESGWLHSRQMPHPLCYCSNTPPFFGGGFLGYTFWAQE